MSPDDPRHGSYAGYQAEYAEGGRATTCTACREAERLYQLKRSKAQAYGRPLKVDATGSVRRVQALMAIGWPGKYIAQRIGSASRCSLPGNYPTVRASKAAKIKEVYEELLVRDGPSNRTRGWAAKLGWATPDQWLGRDIDDPNVQPAPIQPGPAQLDEIAVERALRHVKHGEDRRVELTAEERVALIRRADELGVSRNTVMKYLKVSGSTWSALLKQLEESA